MEDLRKSVRYAVDKTYCGKVEVELHGSEKLRCGVVDLSTSGVSFEVRIISGNAPDGLAEGEDFLITLHINGITLVTGVEKIWSITKESDEGRLYRAGLKFKVLTDVDRLKLNSSIEQIRESIQAAARLGSRL